MINEDGGFIYSHHHDPAAHPECLADESGIINAVVGIEVQGVVVSIRMSMLLAFHLETQLHRDEDTRREGKST